MDRNVSLVLVVLAALVLLPLFVMPLWMMGTPWGHHPMWEARPAAMLGVVLVPLLVLTAVVVLLARAFSGHARDEALRVLDRRFAEGQIDVEEYRHRKDELRR